MDVGILVPKVGAASAGDNSGSNANGADRPAKLETSSEADSSAANAKTTVAQTAQAGSGDAEAMTEASTSTPARASSPPSPQESVFSALLDTVSMSNSATPQNHAGRSETLASGLAERTLAETRRMMVVEALTVTLTPTSHDKLADGTNPLSDFEGKIVSLDRKF